MRNMNFDLVEELSKKLSGVWRFEQFIKDSEENPCPSCAEVWKKIKAMDEQACEMLRTEVIKHVEDKKFD